MTNANILDNKISTQGGTITMMPNPFAMPVRVAKLHPDAVIPSYAKEGDAGLDLTATSVKFDDQGNVHYGTGLAFEIPYGYVGLLFPRSSNSKKDLLLSNSVGVIDSGYRGEIMFKYKPSMKVEQYEENNYTFIPDIKNDGEDLDTNEQLRVYEVGERIGQLIIMPYPQVKLMEVTHDELSKTERGAGGYGSTGK